MLKTKTTISAIVTLLALATSVSASALEWRGRSNDLYPSFEACWAHENTCFIVGRLVKKSVAELMNKNAPNVRKRSDEAYYITGKPPVTLKETLIPACLGVGGAVSKRPCGKKQQAIYIVI